MPEHALAIDCPFCGAPKGKRCKELNEENPFQWVRHYTHLDRKLAAEAVPPTTEELAGKNRHSQSAKAAAVRRYGTEADSLKRIPPSQIRSLKLYVKREADLTARLVDTRRRRAAMFEAILRSGVSRTRLRRFIEKGFELE